MDGSWGQAPLGCSVQLSSQAAVYKTSGNTGKQCIKHDSYQLVCKSSGKCLIIIQFIDIDQLIKSQNCNRILF